MVFVAATAGFPRLLPGLLPLGGATALFMLARAATLVRAARTILAEIA